MDEMQDSVLMVTRPRKQIFTEINEKRVGQVRENGGDGKIHSWSGSHTVAWTDLITETVGLALDADDPGHEDNLAAYGGLRQVLTDIATYAVAAIEEIDRQEADHGQ